ncbi:unnamed protein product [Durusdinium trenchii]|uniref:Uncharacterized protein n=5 Tax=Durusdinium trenchii TaxID=1381693 RepID=A0ABP0STJ5_9DINO
METAWIKGLTLCSQAITEYGYRGQWQQAVNLLAVAQEEGIPVDLPLYRKLINSCRENRQWKSCMQVLRFLAHSQERGLRADAVLYGATMASASDLMPEMPWNRKTAARWPKALQVLDGMRQDNAQRDAASWRIASSACGQGKQWKAAALLLSEMRWATCDVGAEAYTGAMLAALNSEWPAVLSLFRDLRRRPKVKLNTAVLNAAMLATDEAGQPERAIRLLQAVQSSGAAEPNVLSITMAMMSTTGIQSIQDGWSRATRIFAQARSRAIQLNRVAYTALTGIQEHAGRWQLAQATIQNSRAARVAYDMRAYNKAMRVVIGPAVWDIARTVPPLPIQ